MALSGPSHPAQPAADVDSMHSRIMEVFAMYDKSGDHVLDMVEFKNAIEHLGGFSPEACAKISKEVDRSGDGNVSIKEFEAWTRSGSELADDVAKAIRRKTGSGRIARIKQTFERYDSSGDGTLDMPELRQVLKFMGCFTLTEIKLIVADLDKSGDGSVDYQEFEDWIRSGCGSKEINKAKCILAPSDDDGLEGVYYKFCGPGKAEMDGKSFFKTCKDCGLLDKVLTETAVDLIFSNTKVKAKGARTVNFQQFEVALELVCEKKGVDKKVARNALLESGGPVITGTKAEANRFYDDPDQSLRRTEPAKERKAPSKAKVLGKYTPRCLRPSSEPKVWNPEGKPCDPDIWKKFGIDTQAGRVLKKLYSIEKPSTLPSTPNTFRYRSRWPPQADTYVAVNNLRAASYGLHFRRSTRLNDLCPGLHEYLAWGERIQGERVDANWLKVGNRFLPTVVNNVRVLELCSPGMEPNLDVMKSTGVQAPSAMNAKSSNAFAEKMATRSASLPAISKAASPEPKTLGSASSASSLPKKHHLGELVGMTVPGAGAN